MKDLPTNLNQACKQYLKEQQALKLLKEPIKEHNKLIAKKEAEIKNLRKLLIAHKDEINKLNWSLITKMVDVPAFSYEKIEVLQQKA